MPKDSEKCAEAGRRNLKVLHQQKQNIPTNTAYLGESSDSVLIGKERRVVTDLEVKVNRFVRERGELVAEAELVGAIFRCCEGKAIILLLHLFVECSSVWVLQTTIHIIVPTSDNLQRYWEKLKKNEKNVIVELYTKMREYECIDNVLMDTHWSECYFLNVVLEVVLDCIGMQSDRVEQWDYIH